MLETKLNSVQEKIQIPVSSLEEGQYFCFYENGFTCTRSIQNLKTGDIEYFYTSLKTGKKVYGLIKSHNLVYPVGIIKGISSVSSQYLQPLLSLQKGETFTFPLSSKTWKVLSYSKTRNDVYMCQLLNSRKRVVQGFTLDSKIVKKLK